MIDNATPDSVGVHALGVMTPVTVKSVLAAKAGEAVVRSNAVQSALNVLFMQGLFSAKGDQGLRRNLDGCSQRFECNKYEKR
ncbi:hypothetical protein [Pseudomonas moorei]|uniref:hypothetical protein n=1 Tax=Pseudomonas moorei TaxID=395599 RepID=UPI0036F3CA4A